MGFLKVNRVRDPPGVAKRAKKKRKVAPAVVKPPAVVATPGSSAIERLPRELLELVLVHCANFSLPQASPALASKLSRTPALESWILREQMALNGNKLPAALSQLPFITRELLERLEVSAFCSDGSSAPPYVPLMLESHLHKPAVVSLVAFMVEHGCCVESSQKVYLALAATHHWKAVNALADSSHKPNSHVVVLALDAGQGPELAIKLLNLCQTDYSQMWEVQEAAKRVALPEVVEAAALKINSS